MIGACSSSMNLRHVCLVRLYQVWLPRYLDKMLLVMAFSKAHLQSCDWEAVSSNTRMTDSVLRLSWSWNKVRVPEPSSMNFDHTKYLLVFRRT